MPIIFLVDIGSHPPRDLEVRLFDDGELEFLTPSCHINIKKEGVAELRDYLNEHAAQQGAHPTGLCPMCGEPLAAAALHEFC
jgi:hypothetical protein